MAFTVDLIDFKLTTTQDVEYGLIYTTYCPGLGADGVTTNRPARGDTYPGDSGLTARRCLDFQHVEKQGKAYLVVRWVQPIAYSGGLSGTGYLEVRGSRALNATAVVRRATILFVTTSHTAPVSVGTVYPSDTGLAARRCVSNDDASELTTGLWLHRVQYVGFIAFQGKAPTWANSTAYTAGQILRDGTDDTEHVCLTGHTSSASPATFAADRGGAHEGKWRYIQEIHPRTFLDKSHPNASTARLDIEGSRTFLIEATSAVDSVNMAWMTPVTAALRGSYYPTYTGTPVGGVGDSHPWVEATRVEMFPEGVLGVSRLTCRYDRTAFEKRAVGYARIIFKAIAKAQDAQNTADRNGAIISGPDPVNHPGPNEWKIVKGENVRYDGHGILVLQTAYSATTWQHATNGYAGFMALRGTINLNAFYGVAAKSLLYLGPQFSQSFGDAYIQCDHTFLYDPLTWEANLLAQLGAWVPEQVEAVDGAGDPVAAGPREILTWKPKKKHSLVGANWEVIATTAGTDDNQPRLIYATNAWTTPQLNGMTQW